MFARTKYSERGKQMDMHGKLMADSLKEAWSKSKITFHRRFHPR